jgi:hypothetical protein
MSFLDKAKSSNSVIPNREAVKCPRSNHIEGFVRKLLPSFERPNRTNLKHCLAEVPGEFGITKRTMP